MDTLLWPLKVAVAWVMVTIHKALVLIGFPDGPGIAWVLSIIGLTIVVRLLIMPLFVKQIRASRGMQLLQPELQALQAKYKGKKDPESRQRMNEEMMALYRKHGTNPMASCLPILVQMPIFFALFRVLASLGAVAAGKYGRPSIGPLTQQLAEFFNDPLHDPLIYETRGKQTPDNATPAWKNPTPKGGCGGTVWSFGRQLAAAQSVDMNGLDVILCCCLQAGTTFKT